MKITSVMLETSFDDSDRDFECIFFVNSSLAILGKVLLDNNDRTWVVTEVHKEFDCDDVASVIINRFRERT